MLRFLTLSLLFTSLAAYSQEKPVEAPKKKPFGLWFSGSYTAQIPKADMAERYGYSHKPAFNVTFVSRNNFLWGAEGGMFFSQQVNDLSILNQLAPNGTLLDASGYPVSLSFNQRGYQIHAFGGKFFNLSKRASMHGPVVWAGAGFLQHKIQIFYSQALLPYLDDEYKKGYDRMTYGLVLNQFVGYTYFNRRKTINFFAGLEFNEGFTYPRRSYNFDTRTRETGLRNDILLGAKAGIIIPVYFHPKDEDMFFK